MQLHLLPRLLALSFCAAICLAQNGALKTRNIIYVMADGLRWQDAFSGADPALSNRNPGGVADIAEFERSFWRTSAAERRQALLPFIWGTVARQGQLYGNRTVGSDASVTNGHNFSYPGYSETFCGYADARVDSNDKVQNPNRNVLEWLNQKPAFKGRIAAFGAWELFPWILNSERSGVFVNAGYEPYKLAPLPAQMETVNRLKSETGYWDGEPFDEPVVLTALHHLRQHKPRVLFVSLGETDEWAHYSRYDLYLKSAQRFDKAVRELWEAAQQMSEYRGSTTLIVSVDHGRGLAPTDWKSHGARLDDSKYIWLGFMGPDTPALGERSNIPAVTENQIAATLAALLGEDYNAAESRAGRPIGDVLRH